MLQNTESDTLFEVVFLDFRRKGDILDWDAPYKILTCLDFMTGFVLGEDHGLKETTSE